MRFGVRRDVGIEEVVERAPNRKACQLIGCGILRRLLSLSATSSPTASVYFLHTRTRVVRGVRLH